jgi:hypothetical protein
MRTLALLLVLTTACTAGAPPAGDDDGGDDDVGPGPDGGADDPDGGGECPTGDPFAPAGLEDGVRFLASDELGGRASDTPGDAATRDLIEDAFRCAGLAPGGPGGSYQQPFVAPDGTAAANVIGYLEGSDPSLAGEVVILGAHHDHLGTMGGQIYNGANDNASGVMALLAVARALAEDPPARTVGFVTFGYEEHDGNCEGSEYYVDHAPAALAMNRVTYMIDLDMVGTYQQAGEVSVYGANAGTPGRTILDGLAGIHGLDLAHEGNAGTDDSDFQAFADLGIRYVYFETWDDACYHQPCDDAARIDYAGMASIARLSRDLVVALASD